MSEFESNMFEDTVCSRDAQRVARTAGRASVLSRRAARAANKPLELTPCRPSRKPAGPSW